MSQGSLLQQAVKLLSIAATDEEAVGIVALGQGDQASGDAPFPKTSGEALRCLRAAAVGVGIKGQIDGSSTVAQLPELTRIEVGSQRAADVVKAGLPQYGIVEQSLDENHLRILPDLVPCVQSAFSARQKPVRGRRSRNAAAIEIAFSGKTIRRTYESYPTPVTRPASRRAGKGWPSCV